MDAEQLFSPSPLKSAGKGARSRQAARRQAAKDGRFADTLAALASGGRKAGATTGVQPASKPAFAVPETRFPLGARRTARGSCYGGPREPDEARFAGHPCHAGHPGYPGRAGHPGVDPFGELPSDAPRTDKSRQAARRRAAEFHDAPTQAAPTPGPAGTPAAVEAADGKRSRAIRSNADAAGTAQPSRKETAPASTAKAEPRKGHGASRRHPALAEEAPRPEVPAASDGTEAIPAAAALSALQTAAAQATRPTVASHPHAVPAEANRDAIDASARKQHRSENTAGNAVASRTAPSRASSAGIAPKEEAGRPAFPHPAGTATDGPGDRDAAGTVPGARPEESLPAASAARRNAAPRPAAEAAPQATRPDTGAVPTSVRVGDFEAALPQAPAGPDGTAHGTRTRPHGRHEAAPGSGDPSNAEPRHDLRAESPPAARPAETAFHARPSQQPSFTARPVEAPTAPAASAEPLAATGKAVRTNESGKHASDGPTAAREAVSPAAAPGPASGGASGERRGLPQPGDSPLPFVPAGAAVPRAESAFAVSGADPATPAASPDSAPLHQQVGMRLVTLPDGVHEVALTLAPENLGKLQIDLTLSGGRMDAVVRAENPDAREALLRDVPALREALASSGIVLSSFDVSLSGGGNPAEQQAPRQAGGWETDQGHRPRRESEAGGASGGFQPGRASSGESAGSLPGHWIA